MSRTRNNLRAGAMSIQFIVILVPVLLGFMGFAVDLGRLYLVRGELNQAASAMAMAAAAKLNGTSAATDAANIAARITLDDSVNDGNRFNFGSILIGQTAGSLTSSVSEPGFFASAADARQAVSQAGLSTADGTTARHVTVNLTADAPLLFWSLLSLGQSRKTSIAGAAAAGISAPVCTACGIEPFALAAPNIADTTDFGLIAGTLYTMGFQCNGAAPALLAGTTARLPYLIIDRYNTTNSTFAEDQQLFRTGAQGLLPTTTPALSCAVIGAPENIWATATPRACNAAAPNPSLQQAMCGLSSRFADPNQFAACSAITDVGTLSTAYLADTDITSVTDYTAYLGDNRRLITVPIMDTLSTTGGMTVLGFRQFLIQPTAGTAPAANNPGDADGRFVAMYAGSVAPVKQGFIGGACSINSGPGKVVLHQ